MKKIYVALTALLLALVLLGGCASSLPESSSASESKSEISAPEKRAPEALIIDNDDLDLFASGKSAVLNCFFQPNDADVDALVWSSSDESVATVSQLGEVKGVSAGECVIKVSVYGEPEVSASVNVSVRKTDYFAPALTLEPVENATYIDGILIANKTYALPEGYDPGGILPEVMTAWEAMVAAAAEDGYNLTIISGYRSYDTQYALYNRYVSQNGQAAADTYSARPGHSEHQTGLAFDINTISYSFGETPTGQWVSEHGHEYGFIIRYPEGKQPITGYIYEPWHLRFLGTELATKVYESGLCLEEYLGIDSVYASDRVQSSQESSLSSASSAESSAASSALNSSSAGASVAD